MNHRIFERKSRSLDTQWACLSECRLQSCALWCGVRAQVPCWTCLSKCLNLALCDHFGCFAKAQLASVLSALWNPRSFSKCSLTQLFQFQTWESCSFDLWPQIKQDYPLNLSILISGGKETNKDSPSNGEWSGMSSNLKSLLLAAANCSLEKRFSVGCALLKLLGTAHRRGWQSRMRQCALMTMCFLWVGLLGNAAQNGW